VPAQDQLGLVVGVEGTLAGGGQAPLLGEQHPGGRHAGQEWATPERQRFGEAAARVVGPLLAQVPKTLLDEIAEPQRVDVAARDAELVAPAPGRDHRLAVVPAQQGSQPGDVGLQGRRCARWWLVVPHGLQQRTHRHRLACPDCQVGEHPALLLAAQRKSPLFARDLERAEHLVTQCHAMQALCKEGGPRYRR
jgi:hypothetical protein